MKRAGTRWPRWAGVRTLGLAVAVAGCAGDEGPAGAQGEPGAPGEEGPAGAEREPGAPGEEGAAGAQREPGAPGEEGAAGAQREDGEPSPLLGVTIDIKFCSDPNGFNCKNRGVTPVTIFGTPSFDVIDVDISSLRLCLADLSLCTASGPKSWSIADRGDPTSDLGAAMCAVDPITGEELDWLNQDGFDDLDAAFRTQEVVSLIGCGGLSKGDPSATLVVIGQTTSDAQTVVLDFESLAHAGAFVSLPSPYSEDGFTIESTVTAGSPTFTVFGPTDPRFPGSTALASGTVPATTTITSDSNGTFDLSSIDVSEFAATGCPACVFGGGLLTYTGTKADASTVTHSFVLDQVFGLETVTFPSSFSDLVSVSFFVSGSGEQFHQIDNVVIAGSQSTTTFQSVPVGDMGIDQLLIQKK